MASMTSSFCLNSINFGFCNGVPSSQPVTKVPFCIIQQEGCKRLLCAHLQHRSNNRSILTPILAASSGLQASVIDPDESTLTFKKIEIVVVSRDEDKMQLKVDLSGEETQKAFDIVLENLAREAPPIPGFRRQKGGKTSKVPKNFLLGVLGKERVTKFVIREIVTSATATYAKEENLAVKDNRINTTQTEEELKVMFSPGNAFGFNVVLELENAKPETT